MIWAAIKGTVEDDRDRCRGETHPTEHNTTRRRELGRRLRVGHVEMAATAALLAQHAILPGNNYLAERAAFVVICCCYTRPRWRFVVSLIHPRAGHGEFNATKRDVAGIYRTCEAAELLEILPFFLFLFFENNFHYCPPIFNPSQFLDLRFSERSLYVPK